MIDTEQLVVDALAAVPLGVVGTNIFKGPVRPPGGGIPQAAIFALSSGGPAPDPYFSFGGRSASFYRSNVQVRIRGDVQKYEVSKATAEEVLAALHLADLPGCIACKAQSPRPIYIGLDDTEHPEFSVNVSVWFKE